AARAVRRPDAPGPVSHPGRQGPPPLDPLRRQRAGPGAGLLARIRLRPRPREARRAGARLPPHPDRDRPRGLARGSRRPPPRRAAHPAAGRPGASPAPMARGPVTILGGASPVGWGPSAPRPEIPADVPPVRRPARPRAEGLPGGRAAPDPLPRQPAVLG